MHDDVHFHTDAGGFDLPAAYKSHDGRLNFLVALSILFASVGWAAVLAFQIFRG